MYLCVPVVLELYSSLSSRSNRKLSRNTAFFRTKQYEDTDSQTKRSRKAARRLVVFQLTKTHSTHSSRRFLNHSYQIKTIWFNCGYKIYHVTMSEAYRGNKRRKLHPYYPKQLLPLATSRKKKNNITCALPNMNIR